MKSHSKDKIKTREKAKSRVRAKAVRQAFADKAAGRYLIDHFPSELNNRIIAGFSPFSNEINVGPLMIFLHNQSRQMCLPVIQGQHQALKFRYWEPKSIMATDMYGISYPATGEILTPEVILVPLLAFTERGERLGYGGGYYDRTLASLRSQSEVFACGVAYAGQKVSSLPTDDHDQLLDGILTEDGFRRF